MDRERWQRIDELVQAAMELAPAERDAFLSSACAGDADLRSRVERLLSYDERDFSLFERPAAELAAVMVASASPVLSAGQRLGHYEVVDFLGAGGMGEVYRARDSRLGRAVALKLLPPDFGGDEEWVRRFQAEARAASALNHPNIITIHEIGLHDGARFIATEYIEGETLRRRLGRGPLEPRAALGIAMQVAEALAAAHAAGIVHRDVKPENIMLRPDGYVKVLDFGLAKLTQAEPPAGDTAPRRAATTESIPGRVMGTVRYMSPEQARGAPLDARSDLFSLGVVIYEMAAGRLPFDGGTTSDVIAAILGAEPLPLRDAAPDAPEGLDRIVGRCLRKAPDGRYETADELLRELKALAKGIDLLADMAGRGEAGGASPEASPRLGTRAAPWRRPGRPTGAGALALGGLLLAGAGGYFALTRSEAGPAGRFGTVTKTVLAGSESFDMATISPDGRYVAEVTRGAPDDELWIEDLVARARWRLATGLPNNVAPAFASDSSAVYYCVVENDAGDPNSGYTVLKVALSGGDPVRILRGANSGVCVSPDGRRLAFLAGRQGGWSDLVVAAADGSGARAIASRPSESSFLSSPGWSPDGRMVVCGTRTGVVQVPAGGGAETVIAADPAQIYTRPKWLPDGSGLLVIGTDSLARSQIFRVSAPDGGARALTEGEESYRTFSVTADGSTVLGVRGGMLSSVCVAPECDLGRLREITEARFNNPGTIAWTPDGRILFPFTSGDREDLWVMDADGSNRRQLSHGMNVDWPCMSPDGRYVVFMRIDGGHFEIWRVDADGGDPTKLADGDTPVCSPDGRVIYVAGDRLWEVPIEGGTPRRLTDKPSQYPSVSPDGSLLACTYQEDGAPSACVALFSRADGRLLRTLDIEPPYPMHWSPDGRAVFYFDEDGIWRRPVGGGPATRIARLGSAQTNTFDVRPDGTLVFVRQVPYRDAVLIRSVD